MNDPLAHSSAEKFADRAIAGGGNEQARLAAAFRLALVRMPTSDEVAECRDFLQQYRERLTALKVPASDIERGTWVAFARAFLSGNELIFID